MFTSRKIYCSLLKKRLTEACFIFDNKDLESNYANPHVHFYFSSVLPRLSISESSESKNSFCDFIANAKKLRRLPITYLSQYENLRVYYAGQSLNNFVSGLPSLQVMNEAQLKISSDKVHSAFDILFSVDENLHKLVRDFVKFICLVSIDETVNRLSFSFRSAIPGLIFIDVRDISATETALLIIHEFVHQYFWTIWILFDIEIFREKQSVVSPYTGRSIESNVALQSLILQVEQMSFFSKLNITLQSPKDSTLKFINTPKMGSSALSELIDRISALKTKSDYVSEILRLAKSRLIL